MLVSASLLIGFFLQDMALHEKYNNKLNDIRTGRDFEAKYLKSVSELLISLSFYLRSLFDTNLYAIHFNRQAAK
jgi:hypothetical protein